MGCTVGLPERCEGACFRLPCTNSVLSVQGCCSLYFMQSSRSIEKRPAQVSQCLRCAGIDTRKPVGYAEHIRMEIGECARGNQNHLDQRASNGRRQRKY